MRVRHETVEDRLLETMIARGQLKEMLEDEGLCNIYNKNFRIYTAVKFGKYDIVKDILEYFNECDWADPQYDYPLDILLSNAAAFDTEKMIDLLEEYLTFSDEDYLSAFKFAAKYGNYKMMKKLLIRRQSITNDAIGAIYNNEPEIADHGWKKFINFDAIIELTDKTDKSYNVTGIVRAFSGGDKTIFEEMMVHLTNTANEDAINYLELMIAAYNKNAEKMAETFTNMPNDFGSINFMSDLLYYAKSVHGIDISPLRQKNIRHIIS